MDALARPGAPDAGDKTSEQSQVAVYLLPGGGKLAVEPVPYTRSVAMGIWVRAGSRVEPEDANGIAHLCEHMVFRGTSRRSAQRLAEEMDDMGGEFNAVTGREFTTFFAHVLDQHFTQALDLLGDMVLHATLDEHELEREKSVVLEEIKMYDDDPGALAEELAAALFWSGHALSRPVEGTAESVKKLTAADLRAFYHRYYKPQNMVIAVAGNVDPASTYEACVHMLGYVADSPVRVAALGKPFHGAAALWDAPAPRPAAHPQLVKKKNTEQLHICVVADGLSANDVDIYAWQLLASVLGGGNASRLFRRIRDELGLAYAISSYPAALTDTGYTATYVGVEPAAAGAALEVIVEEMARLCEEEPSVAELARAKEQLKTGLVLSMESLSSRMTTAGNALAGYGPLLPVDEVLQRIDAVSTSDLKRLARRLFRPDVVTMAAVGPVDGLPDIQAVVGRFWDQEFGQAEAGA